MEVFRNPHDRFVRDIFKEEKNAVSFFKTSLPKEISRLLDWKEFHSADNKFMLENLEQREVDLLFSVGLSSGSSAKIYLLFEHKSYRDTKAFLQILGYLTEIYKNQSQNRNSLSVVIPVIFYQAQNKWDSGKRFIDQFELDAKRNPQLHPYIPDFEILLFPLSEIDIPSFFSQPNLKFSLYLAQNIRANKSVFLKSFYKGFQELKNIDSESERLSILKKGLSYVFSVRKEKVEDILSVLNQTERSYYKEEIMTTAERLNRQGFRRGVKLEKLNIARKMISLNFDLKTILKVTELSKKDLKDHKILP
ncbi:Rpn family recombination-promoting nuclease/putative transposase [Leptospira sarikeiensis]|nr:Rpn family recombination-promoting nuclease/putative transposase [Leptospira sarikeiensis]